MHYFTVSIFETGEMATPTKLQNPTIMGLGVLASTQGSHPSRFRHWHSSFGDNGYLHLSALHKTNSFSRVVLNIFLKSRLAGDQNWI